MKGILFRNIVMVALGVFLLLSVTGCSHEEEKDLQTKAAAAKAFENPEFDTPEYVGSLACKNCHWREYDAWKYTLHSKTMQLPDQLSVMGDFETNNRLTVTTSAEAKNIPLGEELTITMLKKGDKYIVNTIGPDGEFHNYEVSHTFGLNHKQSYLTRFPNGALYVLPVQWDVEKQQWSDFHGLASHTPGDGGYWSDSSRIWQFNCAGCHTTGLKINYDSTTDSFETGMIETGIACEACHGPGSNHVKAASFYFDHEQETIINPRKLSWRLSAMVCGQCHKAGLSAQEVTPHKEGFPDRYAFPYGYDVGKPLYNYFAKEPDYKGVDHQYNQWQQSQHGRAGVICIDCHSVHEKDTTKPVNKALTRLAADKLCKSCHTSVEKRAAHRIHTFGSCIACHMPKLDGHLASHTFQFVSPEESLKAGGVDKLMNSCSSCHHHKDSPLDGLIEFMEAAKKHDMPKPFSAHIRPAVPEDNETQD
jgi:formate-dependent nitrite reductase cytochrome c552 subunit